MSHDERKHTDATVDVERAILIAREATFFRIALPQSARAARALRILGAREIGRVPESRYEPRWVPAIEIVSDKSTLEEISHLVFFRLLAASGSINLGREMGDSSLIDTEVSLCCLGIYVLKCPAAQKYLAEKEADYGGDLPRREKAAPAT